MAAALPLSTTRLCWRRARQIQRMAIRGSQPNFHLLLHRSDGSHHLLSSPRAWITLVLFQQSATIGLWRMQRFSPLPSPGAKRPGDDRIVGAA